MTENTQNVTLYELNKQFSATNPPMGAEQLVKKIQEIATPFFSNHEKYFMMLCHERRDYTVFHLLNEKSPEKASLELLECLNERGQVIYLNETNTGDAIEIWLRALVSLDGEVEDVVYYLFPYDSAVLHC